MAAVTATQLDVYTPFPSADGLVVEVYRTASATNGDTITLTPKRGRFIRRLEGPVSHNLSTSGNSTNVSCTIAAGAAGSVDITLFVQP